MKKMTYTVSLAALATTGALALGAGTANAAPAVQKPADPHTLTAQIAPGVQYTGNTTDSSTVLSSPIGTVTTERGQVQVTNAQGRTLFGQQFPTQPRAATTVQPPAGNPAVPTATTAQAAASSASVGAPAQSAAITPAAQPVDNPAPPAPKDPQKDFESALGTAATNFGLATGVGSMVGGVAGLVVGCPIGMVTGGTLTAVTVVGTPAGIIGGCVLGAATLGGLGALVGGAAVGAPVGIASAAQMYNTLHAEGDA
ncbi:hypothetical protein [Nocardia alni]|uniref:hypothetical protein n=1 Tax=Nocardia alni TaxID=2815723 RepID=UPI001C24201F|nr:hypothetical protein [Nocardia alni]